MQRDLSSHDFVRIAAEAVVSPQTVKRVYAGRRCEANTLERVRRAAVKLGLPTPHNSERLGEARATVHEGGL